MSNRKSIVISITIPFTVIDNVKLKKKKKYIYIYKTYRIVLSNNCVQFHTCICTRRHVKKSIIVYTCHVDRQKKKKTQRDTTDHDKTNIFLSATRKSSRKNSFAVNEGQRNYKKRARIPLQLSFNITRFIYIYIYINLL